jgi:tripartite-type tricarboxylate transporter receptor subunit TctC
MTMRSALLVLMALFGTLPCYAQDHYPSRPVRLIIPFAPGGATDTIGRLIAERLSLQLGQPFVVENRSGATGTIGAELVARSMPDGYTLLLIESAITIVPNLQKSHPIDVARDFTPIAQIARMPLVLVVEPKLTKVTTLQQLVAMARANPGKLNFASSGTGSIIHLSTELFKRAADVNIAHIPYKGGSEPMTALLGGQVDMLLATTPTVLPYVKSGRVIALGVTSEGERSPIFPDVPSMSEAGIRGMTIYFWLGIAGPAGIPKGIVTKLHTEIAKAVSVPTVKQRLLEMGVDVIATTPEQFSEMINGELQRWGEAIRAAGIKAE